MRSVHRLFGLSTMLGVAMFVGPNGGPSYQPDDPSLPPPQFSIETRGPVHEAFAQPNEGKPELSVAVGKEPPPPLPEQPPEQRPDNPNMEWIPGYWAWDSDRNNFVWVSGTFRDPPPGRRWVPGHWSDTPEGWRWAPGFWIDENQKELRYTPEPPAPFEAGPILPPPDDQSHYVPGYWYYDDAEQRFVWRPGYWAPFRDDRMWINPQYHWTPSGYVFTDGYWDRPLDNRGILYAPAYFPTPLWNNPGWIYRPSFIVAPAAFYNAGFYRPGYNHFYYGNYYGNNYANLGFRPWWGGTSNPAFNYYAWQNRNTPQFVAQQQQLYNNRMNGKASLPPTTFAQQQTLLKAKGAQAQALVTPAAKFAPTAGKLVPNTQVAAQNLQIKHVQELSVLRANAERVPAKASTAVVNNVALTAPTVATAPPRMQSTGAGASAVNLNSGLPNANSGLNNGRSTKPALNTSKYQPAAGDTGRWSIEIGGANLHIPTTSTSALRPSLGTMPGARVAPAAPSAMGRAPSIAAGAPLPGGASSGRVQISGGAGAVRGGGKR